MTDTYRLLIYGVGDRRLGNTVKVIARSDLHAGIPCLVYRVGEAARSYYMKSFAGAVMS